MQNIKEKFKFAFTLVENLTVILILGIIILLVLPNMIRTNNDRKNKIVLRKSVMTYQGILRKNLLLTTGITSRAELDGMLSSNDCRMIRRELSLSVDNGCVFKTTDGIWWDVSTPSMAIVSFGKSNDLTLEKAASESKKEFFITYAINNHDISILRTSAALSVFQEKALEKTTDFLMNE